MKVSPQGGVPSGRTRAIENLIHGHGHAKELEDILASARNNPDWDGELARDLAEKVRRSFDDTVSELMIQGFELEELEGLRHRPPKRGGRRSNGKTRTEFSPGINADDGHQWRKYGQKSIHGATHPRHYFRCTHKIGQGCLATKQVQKVSDNPITFRSVYRGHHTCNDDRCPKTPDDRPRRNDHDSNNDSSVLLSFEHGSRIDSAPLKKEETGEDFFGNKGAALFVSSAPSDNNCCGLFGPQGDITASASHHGGYLNMMMGWEDAENFMLDYGSPSGRGCDQF
ncbi:hypothetical protein MLD38_029809 [Melastoma candidum]|uniref:Uncharacterized protein n=1 Tax=Melastoma candidum TaxID=119954 RepID=A0ACB9N7A1_9MYRT|nr:hypothetical protein MLD38_029809 [Melastoma candidum]